jgi:hypothetical protein
MNLIETRVVNKVAQNGGCFRTIAREILPNLRVLISVIAEATNPHFNLMEV